MLFSASALLIAAVLVFFAPIYAAKGAKPDKNLVRMLNKSAGIITNEIFSGNYYNKITAIEAAGSSKDPVFIPKLKPLLEDPKNEVRLYAVKALFELGSLDGVKVAEDIVKAPVEIDGDQQSPLYKMRFIAEENIKLKAASLLGDIGGPESANLLKSIKAAETGRMRDAASVAMAKLGDATETILFERALKDKDAFVRLAAVQALSEVSSSKTIPEIKNLLNDQVPEIRAEAARALGNIGSPEVVEDLKSLLLDPVDTVRGGAIEALGKLGDRSVVPVLKKLLEDQNGSIRLIAARSLGQLGSPDGLEVIKDGIKNKDSDVKNRVLSALEAINHKDALEHLNVLVDDPSDAVRIKAAAILIKKINRIK